MSGDESGSAADASVPSDSSAAGGLRWDSTGAILIVAAERSVGSVLKLVASKQPIWVVIVRPVGESDIYYYAYLRSEIESMCWASVLDPSSRSLSDVLDLHETKPSTTSLWKRLSGTTSWHEGPAATRTVDLDVDGNVVAIGTRKTAERETRGGARSDSFHFGTMRGGGGAINDSLPHDALQGGSGPPPIEITLSAETQSELEIGKSVKVKYQIELNLEALPLQFSLAVLADPDADIVVSLSAETDCVAITSKREFPVRPPHPGDARSGFFIIKGIHEGVSRLAVTFRQGGTQLGVIPLIVNVVRTGASTAPAKGKSLAASRDMCDDDSLVLLIEERVEEHVVGGVVDRKVFYDYTLNSQTLEIAYLKLQSRPLLDSGAGPAATARAFIDRIYGRVMQRLQTDQDREKLRREVRALGLALCEELFEPEVASKLWMLRDRIKVIEIVSWEPYIPWEMVCLRDPNTQEQDDRFLCEYGMVRRLTEFSPPLVLSMKDWAYLGAVYKTKPKVGADMDFFTQNKPGSLRARGVQPQAIDATHDAFYTALNTCDFDVLHISCHAESPHQRIDEACLFLGDEPTDGGGTRSIEFHMLTVKAVAQLDERRPIVFLNACETGRMGAVMTAWGGWPKVFLRKGAGAFIGTAWSVYDNPAAEFSTTFYNAMLDGKPLVEAANAARQAAKQFGDASWLAFKVYGHPRARRPPPY